MSHHIVELNNLSFAYPDAPQALTDINVRFTHGESVGIVGENGAGKSSLLLHLVGILRAKTGTVRIGDVQLTDQTLHQIRRTVGMVFQDPDDQLFMPAVEDDVAFGPLNMGLTREEVEKRLDAALGAVDALHLRKRSSYRLSGGEKKRVAIASVLALDPDILVMDEPTAGLDPASREHVMALLEKFRHTRLIATHDLDLVLRICSRVVVLHEGRILADGEPHRLLTDEALLRKAGLRLPLALQACPVCAT